MSDQVINLVLRYRDQGSANAKRAMDAISKGMSDTGRAAQGAAQQAMRVHDQLRKVTGLRPNPALPRWFREIGTAADQTAARVQRLTQGVGKFVTAWGQAAAGAAAGVAVLAGPVRKTMGYDTQLRGVVNTAYAGESIDVRRARMATINDAVMRAVRAGQGGATREDALSAVKELTGSNVYKDPREALAALPSITRAAAANGSTSTEFAKIALAARQTMGLTDTDRVLNMATRAGQLGGFEIADMARALPAQLAGAKNAGLAGWEGYASLLALNQAARTTAGSPDQAANNVTNLLGKLVSPDTAADFKKLGIDQTGSLLKAQENGTNVLEAFGNVIDQLIARDPKYAELSKKAASATGDEQKALYSSMAQIVEGRGIGTVLQDREALMAFLGFRNQRQKYAMDKPRILNPGDANGDNLALMAESPEFKAVLMAEEAADRMQDAMNKVNPLLGGMAEQLTTVMQEFPNFSSAIIASTVALNALVAAAGVAAGVGLLMNKGKFGKLPIPGGKPPVPGRVWNPLTMTYESAPAAASTGSRALSMVGNGAAALGPLAVMYGVTEWAGDTSQDQARSASLLNLSGGLSSLLSLIGLNKESEFEAARARSRDGLDTSNEIKVKVDVQVVDGNIVASVNDTNARQARRQ